MELQKTPVPGIYRSADSNALLNLDNDALTAYKLKKQKNRELDLVKESV